MGNAFFELILQCVPRYTATHLVVFLMGFCCITRYNYHVSLTETISRLKLYSNGLSVNCRSEFCSSSSADGIRCSRTSGSVNVADWCVIACLLRDKKLSSDMYEAGEEQADVVAAAAELQSSSDIDDEPTRDTAMLKDLHPADGDAVQPGTSLSHCVYM